MIFNEANGSYASSSSSASIIKCPQVDSSSRKRKTVSITLTERHWHDIQRLVEVGHDDLSHVLSSKDMDDYEESEVADLERLQGGEASTALSEAIKGLIPAMRVKLSDVLLDNDERETVSLTLDIPEIMEEDELSSYIDDRIAEVTGYCHMGYSMERLL